MNKLLHNRRLYLGGLSWVLEADHHELELEVNDLRGQLHTHHIVADPVCELCTDELIAPLEAPNTVGTYSVGAG